MEDFASNSRRAKVNAEPREKIEQVTSAAPVRRKRGLGRQFRETFIGGDARSAMEYVVFHVLIPSAKDTLFDAFESGLQRLIYGEEAKTRRSGASTGYAGLGHVAYNRMSTSTTKSDEPRTISRRARARNDFDELVIPTRQEAEEVIDRMFEWLSRYGQVSVADLYEMTGVQSSHTDMKWGWVNLRGAKAVRWRSGGYLLDLPEPEPFT